MNLKIAVSLCFLGVFSSVSANESVQLKKGAAAISFGYYDGTETSAVMYRQMATDTVAFTAGVAARKHTSAVSGREYDALEIIGSYRKYLVTTDLRQFAEAEMRFVSIDYKGSSDQYKGKGAILGAYYGLEYFVAKRFSFDGRVGAEYIYVDYDEDDSADLSDIPSARLGLNYYWD